MRMHSAVPRRAPGLALLSLALVLVACDRTDERSAGQKVDAAIARTQQTASDVAARAESFGAEARAKVEASEPALQKGYDTLKETARNTGEAVSANVGDALITTGVAAGLARDPSLSATRIDVDTRGGVVTLRGPAPSAEAKARAEVIAGEVKGVSRVDNRLEVKPL